VSPVKYEKVFYIPEDGILHSHRCETSNLTLLRLFTETVLNDAILICTSRCFRRTRCYLRYRWNQKTILKRDAPMRIFINKICYPSLVISPTNQLTLRRNVNGSTSKHTRWNHSQFFALTDGSLLEKSISP
jgi:hypothetical protein